uniref:Retrotransposon protein, putative, Ty3-gypsy subclass n=1 Tax=Oryza sativa subsp. japonica TaxID=39947 RepID=Q33A14_ORYSJ|nr:retrotransposon protein, putative, Ty3-gypsy subclass [Oryza sativa Japonica Group]
MDDHDYVGDSEDDADQRRLRFNRRGRPHRRLRREVRNNDDSFGKTKFTIPAFDAEREVQGRHAQTWANIPTGRTLWVAWSGAAPAGRASSSTSTSAPSNSNKVRPTPSAAPSRAAEAAAKPAKSASSVASTGRTRDVQCHRCKGFGHMQHDRPSKRVLVVKDDSEYSSASDFDEDTLALLAANNKGSEDEEHIGADVADQYESLIVQRVLSVQMGKAEQNQRHNLFQTKSNQYSFVHNGKKIVLHPMTPEAVFENDVARAKKEKNVEHAKCENQIVAKELVHHNKKGSKSNHSKDSVIKLNGPCLLATKSDIVNLDTSDIVCYALICKDALFSFENMPVSFPPAVTNLLQEYEDVFPKDVPPGLPPEYLDHLRVVFNALRDARLFGNLENCTFCTDRISFLGYVVTP